MPRSTEVAVPKSIPAQSPLPPLVAAADFAALSDAQERKLAGMLAAMRDAKLSGDAIREYFAHRPVGTHEGVTGPRRRALLRKYKVADGRVARSYGSYRDGNPRVGTPRIAVKGSKAALAHAEEQATKPAPTKPARKSRKRSTP